MTYVDGFVCAVPTANKQRYYDFAKQCAPVFKQHGALSMVECWGDEVPDGEVNSLRSAVMLKDDETVVFSWITWPDKATRDAGMTKAMEDPALAKLEMPLDGKRMIFGGFDVLLEIGDSE